MSVDLLIFLVAIVVAWLVFTWLVQVVKASIKTALTIATIVLILQVFLGIGPQDLWQEIINLPQSFYEIFTQQ